MKSGAEIHFLAGQLFTLGVAVLAVAPRMPRDDHKLCSIGGCVIGGNLSYPFRRALVGLVGLGIVRILFCHWWSVPQSNNNKLSETINVLDITLGCIHVVGQSFLCMTTAYILQKQLSSFVNIAPGRDLLHILAVVFLLTALGTVFSEVQHARWWGLVNLAEALSCRPVLRTLQTYASVTTAQHGRGSLLTQVLRLVEYWYCLTSLLSFVSEFAKEVDPELNSTLFTTPQLLLTACHQNHNNGMDDWTRLLIHSIFLNSIDEMQHFTAPSASAEQGATEANQTAPSGERDDEMGLMVPAPQSKFL